jgi:hypothetical protein
MTIWFGLDDNLNFQVTGIKKLLFEVDNNFHVNKSVLSAEDNLIKNKSNIEVDCVAAVSPDIYQIQKAAITVIPINAKVKIDDLNYLYGTFFISRYSSRNSTGDILEAHFTLKSSGEYHVRDM